MKIKITNIQIKTASIIGLNTDYDAIRDYLSDYKPNDNVELMFNDRLLQYYLRSQIAMSAAYSIDYDVEELDRSTIVLNKLESQEWSADVFDGLNSDRFIPTEQLKLMYPTSMIVDVISDDLLRDQLAFYSEEFDTREQVLNQIAYDAIVHYLPIDIRVDLEPTETDLQKCQRLAAAYVYDMMKIDFSLREHLTAQSGIDSELFSRTLKDYYNFK